MHELRCHQRLFVRPAGLPGPFAIMLAAVSTAAGPAMPAAAPAPPAEAIARTIQNACFASYPPALLATMSGRDGPAPPEVREDPARQMKYLRTESVEDRGLFYPSRLEEILPGLAAAVRPGARFLDLGSGDGRVVFMAAVLGAEATGIEYDRGLHQVARRALDRLEAVVPRDRVRLRRGDFFRADWSAYDVVFYFGTKGTFAEDRLFDKLRREMGPGAVLLLAYVDDAPDGFAPVETHGVVRSWRPLPAPPGGADPPR